MDAITAVLRRFGGVMLAPRRTVAALPPDEGQADGWILGSLYVVAVGTYPIMEGLAGVLATRDLNAFIMLASILGRLLIAPIVVLVAAETVLGAQRSYRRAVALVPMLAVAATAPPLAALRIPVSSLALQIAGGLAGLALTWWARASVPALKAPKSKAGGTSR